MELWWNIPLFLIVAPLMCAAVCSVLKANAARYVMTALAALECAGMAVLLQKTLAGGESYVYAMGTIGAPFGNELRIGVIEALMGLAFSMVILLSILGGWKRLAADVAPNRMNLYATMVCLLCAAMAAMVFTNDLFTGYVFIEISTIAACSLICASNQGHTLFAATRYMIMNLLGSGLFLLGLSMLYCLTGHLLFPQLGEGVRALIEKGVYRAPLYLSFLLLTLGIAVKSALYPFHTWLPGAYSAATPTSSAILSSLISKIYIFLLIKILVRASGTQVFTQRIDEILMVFAIVGMIMGSVDALRERHLSRMVAYSSVAQIGYVFLGISLGTQAGTAAALFHILAHSAAKSMLFLSANRLRDVSKGSDAFPELRGAAKRCPVAGAAFAIGALSITGLPVLGGFASKVFLAQAGIEPGGIKMIAVLCALAVSTVLNIGYMLRTLLTLYRDPKEKSPQEKTQEDRDIPFILSMTALIAINAGLGFWGGDVMSWIQKGLALFA